MKTSRTPAIHRLFLLFTIVVFNSCIDEVNLTTGGNEPKLVIDGWISNDPDLSYVKVYYSAPYQSGAFFPLYKQPDVYKIYVEAEKEGTIIDFNYIGLTPFMPVPMYTPWQSFDFQEGERYRLNILMKDQSHYQSPWQDVAPAPHVSGLDYELIEKTVFKHNANGPPIQQNQYFLDIKANISNTATSEYGYYIKTQGIEEAVAMSDNEFCSCVCYVSYENVYGKMNVVSSKGFQNPTIQRSIGSIPMNKLFRFHVNIGVYTLSGPGSEYMVSISDQQNNTGSIFDPAPSKIRGNVINLTNPGEEVLGNFFTANYGAYEQIVNRAAFTAIFPHHRFMLELLPKVAATCTEFYTDGTTIRPIPFR